MTLYMQIHQILEAALDFLRPKTKPQPIKPQIIQDVSFDFSFDYKKVWELEEKTVKVPIEKLLWHFDIPFLDKKGTDDWNLTIWELLLNPYREDEHWKKILDADLNYPIDLMENK